MFKKKNATFVVLMLSLGYALALFQRMAFGSVGEEIAHSFHLTVAETADLGAIFFWGYLFFQIPVGLFADAMGSRRAAVVGAALCALGCFELAVASNIWTMGAARVLISAGAAFAFVSMVRYASLHFSDEPGSAVGRGLLIGNVGSLAAGAPLAYALTQTHYQAIWLTLSAIYCALGLAVMLWAPETHGPIRAREAFAKAAKEVPVVFSSPWTYLGLIVLAGLPGAYYAFSAQAAPRLLADFSLNPGLFGWMLTISAGGFALGNFFWGWVSDRAPRRVALLVALLGALACWGALMSLSHPSAGVVGALFFAQGLFCAPTALVYSMIGQKFSPALRGGALGAVNCGIPLGGALCQNMAGRLGEHQMLLPMVIAACASLAMVGISFMIPERKKDGNTVGWDEIKQGKLSGDGSEAALAEGAAEAEKADE